MSSEEPMPVAYRWIVNAGDIKWSFGAYAPSNAAKAEPLYDEKALRSAARTGPEYSAGFDALTSREVVAAVQKAIANHPHFEGGSCTAFGFANTAMKAAIAALPAPAGESVTVEDLAQILNEHIDHGYELATDLHPGIFGIDDACRSLLSTFTITRKSEDRS